MNTINKNDYPEVFMENEEMTEEDMKLFREAPSKCLTENEREFFARMQEKEEGECAPSADLVMDEDDNADGVYIVRYFYDEYRIGKRPNNVISPYDIRTRCLYDALNYDLYPVLGEHISLLEWLRKIDFKGINYNGNFILNR